MNLPVCVYTHHTTPQGTIDGEERGLVPRAVQALGQGIEADTSGAEFEVREGGGVGGDRTGHGG